MTLDIRYARKTARSWGELSWYIEALNVFMTKAKNTRKWYCDRTYEVGVNPEIVEEEGFSFLSGFGIEKPSIAFFPARRPSGGLQRP